MVSSTVTATSGRVGGPKEKTMKGIAALCFALALFLPAAKATAGQKSKQPALSADEMRPFLGTWYFAATDCDDCGTLTDPDDGSVNPGPLLNILTVSVKQADRKSVV